MTYIPYQSDFSTAGITALADFWSAMAGTFAAETATMDGAVQSMAWTGNGYTAAISTWENAIMAGQMSSVPQACQQIADALTAWVQAVEQYEQQVLANIASQQNSANIVGLVEVILTLAGLAAAPFVGALLGVLSDVLSTLIPALSNVIEGIGGALTPLTDTALFDFTTGAVGGAAAAYLQDVLTTWISDDLTDVPFSMSSQQIINDIIEGGLTGGAGGLGASEDPAPDPADLVPNLPAGDPVVVGPAPSLGADPVPAAVSGDHLTAPPPADVVPEGGLVTVIPSAPPPPAIGTDPVARPGDPLAAPEPGGDPPAPDSVVIGVSNVELPSFARAQHDVLLASGPPVGGELPKGIGAGQEKADAGPPDELSELFKRFGSQAPGDVTDSALPPRYERTASPGDQLSASAAHDDSFASGPDEALVRALRQPGGPGFDPGKVREIITERQQAIDRQLDDQPSVNPDALAGPMAHAPGSTSHEERPADPLDNPAAGGPEAADREKALDALAHAVGVKEELADGGRRAGTVYQPEKKTGVTEPPGRWTQISRDLEQITGQRRQLLDEQAGLRADPPTGPKTEAASGRLTAIGDELNKLDDQEAKLFAEQARRWGQPRAGDTEPAPAANKDQLVAELKKVTTARREVLSQRTSLRDSAEPVPAAPEASLSEASVTARLAHLNTRESALLEQAKSLEAAHNLTELNAAARRLTDVSARIGPARQKVEETLTASQLTSQSSRPSPADEAAGADAARAEAAGAARQRLEAARTDLARADQQVQQIHDRWLGQIRGAGLAKVRPPGWLDNPVGRPVYRGLQGSLFRKHLEVMESPVAARTSAAAAVKTAEQQVAAAEQHPPATSEPALGSTAQARDVFRTAVADLNQLTSLQHNLSDTWFERFVTSLRPGGPALPGWVVPRPRTGPAVAAAGRQAAVPGRPAGAPAGTAVAGGQARPAPPLRSALKRPAAGTGPQAGGRAAKSVRFAARGPEQITGGWFFPLDDDHPAVQRAADNLPAFDGHHVVAVHFNQQAGRFEADGRQYSLTDFAARLKGLAGWVPGSTVVLVACVLATASELAAFAASLGSDVLAGLDDVWRTTAGEVVSAPAAAGGAAPDLARPAQWLRVNSDGSPPARYRGTLTAVMNQLGVTALAPDGGAAGQVTGRWPAPGQDVRFMSGTGVSIPAFSSSLSVSGALSAISGSGFASVSGVPGTGSVHSGGRSPSLRSGVAEELEPPVSARELPPGFGVQVNGRRQYPLGQRGRFVRLGDVPLTDDAGIADLVARALPPRSGLGAEVTERALGFLAQHGSRAFVSRLLEGGWIVKTSTGELATVRLDLGDPAEWAQVLEANPERAPAGEITHGAVEADHEVIAGSRRTVASQRGVSFSADVALLPGKPFEATVGAGVGGTSGAAHTSGSDVVSAAKRMAVTHGATAYFDFPGAALVTQVQPAAGAGPAAAGRLALAARAGFPEELAPPRARRGPVFLAVPRILPDPHTGRDSPVLGYTSAQVAADPPGGQIRQAAARIGSLLSKFLTTPESAGLAPARTAVLAKLTQILGAPDQDLTEGVEFFLSEASFLRMWGDISGPGATSPLITATDGRQAYLIVTGELRTVQASTIDHVPVKEEAQRFLNVVDQKTDSGSASVTLPSVKFGPIFGDPDAPPGGNSGLGFQVQGNGSLATDRMHNANTGSGDIRGLVYHGDSVRYLAEMHLTVDVALAGDTPEQMERLRRVDTDIKLNLRVPQIQQARFEAMITDAVSPGTGLVIPRDDQPDADNSVRHPPAALAAGQGTGFTGISHLDGAQKVLPELLAMIRQADAPLAWARPYTALELAFLRSQLSAKFTREALTGGPAALFQAGGERMELFRPARDGGTEIIAVTVRGIRSPDPAVPPRLTGSGRIAEATLEVMPSAFAGNSATDVLSSSIGVLFEGAGTGGLGTRDPSRTLGAGFQIGASRTDTAATGAEVSGFGLEAMLYEGPARYFDYNVTFDIEVSVRHEPATVRTGWLDVLAHLAAAAVSPAPVFGPPAPRPPDTSLLTGAAIRGRVTGGSVRFVIPESLAPRQRADDDTIARTGKVSVTSFAPDGGVTVTHYSRDGSARVIPLTPPARQAGSAAARRQPQIRTVTLPDIQAILTGLGGHRALNPDDQVMEVLGTEQIGRALRDLLAQVGVGPASYGDLPWTITGPAHLGGSMVRGPSVIMNTVVSDGVITNRRATIRIEGYPAGVAPAGPEPVEIFQMHVAEGDATVSSASGQGWSLTAGLSLAWGLLVGLLGGGTQQLPLSGGYTRMSSRARTRTTTITPTTGRLTQARRDYRENTAHMLWRISVVAHDENMIYRSPPSHAAAIVSVERGLSFLRLVREVPDPRVPAGPPPPGIVPQIRRRDAADPARPGALTVPVQPATARPGDNRSVPVVPLVPPSAATERLYPLPPAPGAPPSPPGVTGEGNPTLDMLRKLLAVRAPHLLEAHWTVENGTPAQREVSGPIQNIINNGSLVMMWDLLRGPGLMLTTAPKSLPLASKRVQIRLRARRTGSYTFLESVSEANVSRYTFRLDIDNTSSARTAQNGWNVQLPVNATTSASGPPGVLDSVQATAQPTVTGAISTDGFTQSVDAQRDTLFIPGPADRYSGLVEIEATISTIYTPSRLANSLGLTLPRKISAHLQQAGEHRRPRPGETGIVQMIERVLIPRELIYRATLPDGPPGTSAVREVHPDAVLGRPLNITRDDLLTRKLVNLGFDHERLQILFDEVIAKLAGNELPASGERSAGVRRLTEHGTLARHALHHMLSAPMLTRHLEDMLSSGGFTMPALVREGGPLTDTFGELSVRVQLVRPQVIGYFNGWLESVGYHFAEFNQNLSQTMGWSTDGIVAPVLDTGNLSRPAPARQQVTATVDPSVGASVTRSGYGDLQVMTRATARNRKAPWQRVIADAKITVTVRSSNERGRLRLPGGKVTVAFGVRNALELGVTPEASVRLGLYSPGGIPLPAGRYFPAPGDDASALPAAFNLPLFTKDPATAGRVPDRWVDPRVRDWHTIIGHYDHSRDRFHIGYRPPAGLTFPSAFLELNGLPLDAGFSGGADLTDVEFAAHLWRLFHDENTQFHGRRAVVTIPNLVFAAAHAGAAGPAGAAPFAQRVARYLGPGIRALAPPSHVYHTPSGQTWSASFGVTADGRPLLSGSPDPVQEAVRVLHPWILFSGAVVSPSRSHDLVTVLGSELSDDPADNLRALPAPRLVPPPADYTLLGRYQRLYSPLAQPVGVASGLTAGPPAPALTARDDTVVISLSGAPLTPADQEAITRLPPVAAGRIHLYVAESAVGARLDTDAMLAALTDVVRALPSGQGPVVLHLDLAGALLGQALHELAQLLAAETGRSVRAPDGEIAFTPHGPFAHFHGETSASWWEFSVAAVPRLLGALLADGLPWQDALEQALPRLPRPGGPRLRRIPAGLMVLPETILDEDDYNSQLAAAEEIRPDPRGATIATDPRVSRVQLADLLAALGGEPRIHHLTPPTVRALPPGHPPGRWELGTSHHVVAVRSGLWIRPRQPQPDRAALVFSHPVSTRYRITVDSRRGWDLIGPFILGLPPQTLQRLTLDIPDGDQGPALHTTTQIIAGLPDAAISPLPGFAAGRPRTEPLHQTVRLDDAQLAAYRQGQEYLTGSPVLARLHPGGGYPVPFGHNTRLIYTPLPTGQTAARSAFPLTPRLLGAAIFPAGTRFTVEAVRRFASGPRQLTEIVLTEILDPGNVRLPSPTPSELSLLSPPVPPLPHVPFLALSPVPSSAASASASAVPASPVAAPPGAVTAIADPVTGTQTWSLDSPRLGLLAASGREQVPEPVGEPAPDTFPMALWTMADTVIRAELSRTGVALSARPAPAEISRAIRHHLADTLVTDLRAAASRWGPALTAAGLAPAVAVQQIAAGDHRGQVGSLLPAVAATAFSLPIDVITGDGPQLRRYGTHRSRDPVLLVGVPGSRGHYLATRWVPAAFEITGAQQAALGHLGLDVIDEPRFRTQAGFVHALHHLIGGRSAGYDFDTIREQVTAALADAASGTGLQATIRAGRWGRVAGGLAPFAAAMALRLRLTVIEVDGTTTDYGTGGRRLHLVAMNTPAGYYLPAGPVPPAASPVGEAAAVPAPPSFAVTSATPAPTPPASPRQAAAQPSLAANQPSRFGTTVSRPRRGQHDPPARTATQRLGDQLPVLRRHVITFMGQEGFHPAGVPESEVIERLTAVLAEARNQAGRGPREEPWNALVGSGLSLFPVTFADHAYAGTLPGVSPETLAEGDQFTVADPIRAYSGSDSVAGSDVLYVIAWPAARTISRLVGDQPDLVMFSGGARFLVTGVLTAQAGGRRVIYLEHPASGPAGPMPLPPARFSTEPGLDLTPPQAGGAPGSFL